MTFNFLATFRHGLRLPPAGWTLAALLAFYVLAGLFGRDPWRGEDVIHIGAAWQMLTQGDWLAPTLAGRPLHEPPLYYWSAALLGQLLGAWLPLHDAIRLASGLWVALALTALYYAGREIHGQNSAAATPLLLAGCAGLVVNAHEAQPLLVALAAYCGVLLAVAAAARRPLPALLGFALSLTACLLGSGLAATLPVLLFPLLLAAFRRDNRHLLLLALGGSLLFLILASLWPLTLFWLAPERLQDWWQAETGQISLAGNSAAIAIAYFSRLPSVAFPTLFVALWSLWLSFRQRQFPSAPQWAALWPALVLFVLTLAMLVLAYPPRELPMLLLLPPLALIATPGALALRRGASAALDWFSALGFSFFIAVLWLGWLALTWGWPEKLAQRAATLRPDFIAQFNGFTLLAALAGTFGWLWLLATLPRSPYRSLVRWSMGVTVFWLLACLLLMPWFDHSRSYRPLAEAIAQRVASSPSCIAERDLGPAELASLAYFSGIEAQPYRDGTSCRWLLVKAPIQPRQGPGWVLKWEGNPPDRRRDKLLLYFAE